MLYIKIKHCLWIHMLIIYKLLYILVHKPLSIIILVKNLNKQIRHMYDNDKIKIHMRHVHFSHSCVYST